MEIDDVHTPHSHRPEDIRHRLEKGPKENYLQEWVYGGIDGVVTTFAIVAGVSGASLSAVIIMILGVANLIGDGFSMAASAYSAARTEVDNYERLREIEDRQIDKDPEGEREEIRQIYKAKGFKGEELEHIVETICSDRENWIEIMMQEEYGLGKQQKSPVKTGLHTFMAFCVCGTMPLLPFLLKIPHAFGWALVLSSMTFFAIGSFKSRWSVYRWWSQGLETLAVGLVAAGLSYAIGYGLKNIGL